MGTKAPARQERQSKITLKSKGIKLEKKEKKEAEKQSQKSNSRHKAQKQDLLPKPSKNTMKEVRNKNHIARKTIAG